MQVLVVDNYDSFVFNLVQYLGQLGVDAQVWRNDDDRLATDADVATAAAALRRRAALPRPRHPGARRRLHPAGARRAPRPRPRCSGVCLGPPGDRRGVRRHRRPRTRAAARQDQHRVPRECRCAARPSGPVHRDAVSLADDPARHRARRTRGDRAHRRRRHHGRAARRAADPRRAVPSRVDPHRGRAPDAGQLAGLLRRGARRSRWCAGWRTRSPTPCRRLRREAQRDRVAEVDRRCPAPGSESPPRWCAGRCSARRRP